MYVEDRGRGDLILDPNELVHLFISTQLLFILFIGVFL